MEHLETGCTVSGTSGSSGGVGFQLAAGAGVCLDHQIAAGSP